MTHRLLEGEKLLLYFLILKDLMEETIIFYKPKILKYTNNAKARSSLFGLNPKCFKQYHIQRQE